MRFLPRGALYRLLTLLSRALVWATLAAGAITAVIVWRTAPESSLGPRETATWFCIVWVLCAVPSVALELGVAHLQLELRGEGGDATRPGDEWRE